MAVKVQRRYPLHWVFFAYTLVTLLLAVGAFNANNNLLFWLFGLSLGMLVTSGVLSGTMMMALRVERLGTHATAAGEALVVRYRVTNTGRWLPIFAVAVREQLIDEGPAEPSGTGLRAQQGRVDLAPVAYVAHVPPRSSVEVEGLALAVDRGRLSSSGYEALTSFPFGLIKKSLWHAVGMRVVVPPRREMVDTALLDDGGGRSLGGPSERNMTRAGEELVGLRPYAPGDAQRLVAWRASSRLPAGELVVKQTATGSPRRVRIVLTLRGDAGAQACELAIARAAALVRLAQSRRMTVGLSVWSDFGYTLDAPAGSVPGGAAALINELGLLPLPRMTGHALTDHAGKDAGHALRTGSMVPMTRGGAGDIILNVAPDGQVSAGGRGKLSMDQGQGVLT